MHLQSTLGAFLVAFTMVNGTPVVLQNDQNSRGITTPINVDNLPNKPVGAIDNLPNNPLFDIPKPRQYKPTKNGGQPAPNNNIPGPHIFGKQREKTPEDKERSRMAGGWAKAGGPQGDGRPDGGRAGAAPPVKRSPRSGKRSPRRGKGGRPAGWKGKLEEPDRQTKPPGADRQGPNSDRKDRGPDRKGPDSEKKGGDQNRQGEDSNGIRDGIYDGINDGVNDGISTEFEVAADEFFNQAATNEKRKVPVPDKEHKSKDSDKKGNDASRRRKPWEVSDLPDLSAPIPKPWEATDPPEFLDQFKLRGNYNVPPNDGFATQPANNEKRKVPDRDMKKKKFDDLKEKLDRMDDKDFKPSWRVTNPCGGPACIENPQDNPIMSLEDTLPYAGVPQ